MKNTATNSRCLNGLRLGLVRARISFPALVIALAAILSAAVRPAAAQNAPALKPPGPADRVLFVARQKPQAYRIQDGRFAPFGNARFHAPEAIVAHPDRKCFYVLDRPARKDEAVRIWKIAADGQAEVVYRAGYTAAGGPFGRPLGLGVAPDGHLLVADAATGLWQLRADGTLRRLLDGQTRPFRKITAASGDGRGQILVASSYQYEITGGGFKPAISGLARRYEPSPHWAALPEVIKPNTQAPRHQLPIRIWKNQGGLLRLDPRQNPPGLQGLILNRAPGGAEHDTLWRTAGQVFVDSAGRTILVDHGSKKVFWSPSYGTSHGHESVSEISGGIWVQHSDGRLEELAFKTPTRSSAPLRRPRGAAEWARDTYIVADPEMHVDGKMEGSGGLLLLGIDGKRDPRWMFGWRLKPMGVAILRGAGQAAPAAAPRPLAARDLAGIYRGLRLARVDGLTWQKRTAPTRKPGSPLYGLGRSWAPRPAPAAEQRLAALLQGSTWAFSPGGGLRVVPAGVALTQTDHPLYLSGKVTANPTWVTFEVRYRGKSLFDTKLASLNGSLVRNAGGQVVVQGKVTVMNDQDRLQGAFELLLEKAPGR